MSADPAQETSMDRVPVHKPWWREPMMWLVVGGPAVVVVAGIATAVIAIRNADPVLDTRAAPTAVHGRNHAATPVVPSAPTKP
jgi:hypothetical protein